jgi:hypothetical protein
LREPVVPLSNLANRSTSTDASAFPVVRADVVGATGFEPVTPSVSAKCKEPLCGSLLLQVTLDRKGRS